MEKCSGKQKVFCIKTKLPQEGSFSEAEAIYNDSMWPIL